MATRNSVSAVAERSASRSSSTARPKPLTVIGPNISNVVSGCNLNSRFDLKNIALHGRNAIYNPKRFPAVVLRIREPKSTALIFEGGKMQVLGTKSIDDAKLASRKFARILQKMGYNVRLEDFIVQNMVGSADTRMVIGLEGLCTAHYPYTKYEPELFPGLVYTMLSPKMTVLVFAKGKLVFLGAKRKEDLEQALQSLYPVLVHHRRL
ncbi:hypothetical protein LTR37_011333 [Vermiconidia calcicola]|uniref:Uncharacterized protein n=1 Tax=Vermiconidia calcicola TaxID=1690605 RepID=A0ACC3N379_9PEZI|nr:hypothetical protein LTR37_011333 [Vermiconidia calcicola]